MRCGPVKSCINYIFNINYFSVIKSRDDRRVTKLLNDIRHTPLFVTEIYVPQ